METPKPPVPATPPPRPTAPAVRPPAPTPTIAPGSMQPGVRPGTTPGSRQPGVAPAPARGVTDQPPHMRMSPTPNRDGEIHDTFLKQVASDTAVRDATKKALKVTVKNGVVTLTGTTVSENEREHLNAKLKHFPGFASVVNSLELKPE